MALAWRIFLISLLIAILALTSLSLVVSSWVNDMLREASLRRLADSVNRETRLVQRSLDLLKSDVLVLADLESVSAIARAAADPSGQGGIGPGAQRERLAQTFETLFGRRPSYTQVRLLSAFQDGRELVRVNRMDDRTTVVPDAELQRKGDRYYLEETLKTPPGSIYVSPVDLNREHGAIVEPHQPVFRVGTPVVRGDGTTIGAIVINICFDKFIGEMAPAASDLKLVVTNEDGDFLRHPDPAKRFGFEFGKRYRLQDDLGLSKEWRLLVAEAPVSKVLPEQKVGVVFDRISLDDGNGQAGGKQLVVAALASVSELDTQAGQFRGRILLGALVIGLGLALALGLATRSLTKPIARLTESAARIAAGEPNVSLAYDRNDEIGSLSRTLARMLDSLKEAARNEEMASMGRMASMVAHDLRNALSSVKMNVQILSRRHVDGADPDAAHLRISLDQIQYMESILADMLSFARGDALRIGPVDIGEVLATAVLSEITSIEEKRISLARQPVEGHPIVNGDRVKLVQVFQNLIENAVQACPDGGRISITSRIAEPHRFEVSIADSGEGIAADIRDKVFEPFFTTRSKGTGLGLAIVRRVVKEHGGSVELASAPDGGTVATVCLPLAGAVETAPDDPPLPAT